MRERGVNLILLGLAAGALYAWWRQRGGLAGLGQDEGEGEEVEEVAAGEGGEEAGGDEVTEDVEQAEDAEVPEDSTVSVEEPESTEDAATPVPTTADVPSTPIVATSTPPAAAAASSAPAAASLTSPAKPVATPSATAPSWWTQALKARASQWPKVKPAVKKPAARQKPKKQAKLPLWRHTSPLSPPVKGALRLIPRKPFMPVSLAPPKAGAANRARASSVFRRFSTRQGVGK